MSKAVRNPRIQPVSQGSPFRHTVPSNPVFTRGKNLLKGFLKDLEPEHGLEEVGTEVLSADFSPGGVTGVWVGQVAELAGLF